MPLQSNRNPRRLATCTPTLHHLPHVTPRPASDHLLRRLRRRARSGTARPRAARYATDAGFAAVAAEPRARVGRARDPLRREVRLLGALLGQVIAEQGGPDLFELVERIRRRMIARPSRRPRRAASSRTPSATASPPRSGPWTSASLAAVARAFTLYFQLVNLAEERQRIRVLRRRARQARGRPIDDSIGEAVALLAATRAPAESRRCSRGWTSTRSSRPIPRRRGAGPCSSRSVASAACSIALDAPPHDARRGRRGAPTAARGDLAAVAHGDVRAVAPTPLDEVRSELAIFDETLFTGGPPLPAGRRPRARRRDRPAVDGCDDTRACFAGDTGRTGTRPVDAPALLRLGLVDRVGPGRPPGRDLGRDAAGGTAPGRPPAARLRGRREPPHADRRGPRPAGAPRPGPGHRARPRRGGAAGDTVRQLRRRFPDEPYRQRLGGHRGAAPTHPRRADGRDCVADGRLPRSDRPRRRARRRPGGARRRRAAPRRVWPARRSPLAGRDVRVPPRLAGGPPARGRPSRRGGGAADGVRTGHRGVAGRGARRGPGDVPGRRAPPGPLRRRGLPAVCHHVHDKPPGRDDRPRARATGGRAGAVRGARPCPRRAASRAPRAGRRAAAGVGRGARWGRTAARCAALGSGVSGAPPRAWRCPGGDARVLGLVEGERVPRRQLAPLQGAGGARRDRAPPRRRPHAVPWARRGDRARRGAREPCDSRPGPGFGERAPQVHRAGRGDRRALRGPDDRPAPPRAGHGRHAARLHAGARGRGGGGRGGRCRNDGGADRDLAHRLPVVGRAPVVRGLLPGRHADRPDRRPRPRVASGVASG